MAKVWNVHHSEEEARQLCSKNQTVLDLKNCLLQKPQVLIGADALHKVVGYSSAKPLNSGYVVMQSKVGALISGAGPVQGAKLQSAKSTNSSTVQITGNMVQEPTLIILQTEKEEMNNRWSLETSGISAKEEFSDDKKAIDKSMETIERDETGRYSVSWPWKTMCHRWQRILVSRTDV